MTFEVPEDFRYTESHEWVAEHGDGYRIGITDFAQDELGDIVFVELPQESDDLERGEEFGIVESIKAVSDLYAPISGTVAAVNEELFDAPELVNDDPYGGGWMLELTDVDADEVEELLDASAYGEQIE